MSPQTTMPAALAGDRTVIPGGPPPDLFLTIPVYNESASLAALRQRIISVCDRLGLDYKLLWIDDCSTDRSRELIMQFHLDDPARDHFIFRKKNMGICQAWQDCFELPGRVVGLIPSDGQFAPENLAEVMEAFRGGCDALVVTRPRRADKFSRTVISKLAALLEFIFMGNPYPDIHWVHFWRGGLLGGITWHSRTTAVDAEWSYHVRRLVPPGRVRVLGLPHHPRSAGRSTAGKASANKFLLHVQTFLDLAWAALRLRIKTK